MVLLSTILVLSYQQSMEFLKSKKIAAPKSKKAAPLCCMEIFTGYEKTAAFWELRENGFAADCLREPEVREVWRGCRGYCQRGRDVCAAHARAQQRQRAESASLIQTFVRRWLSTRSRPLARAHAHVTLVREPPGRQVVLADSSNLIPWAFTIFKSVWPGSRRRVLRM